MRGNGEERDEDKEQRGDWLHNIFARAPFSSISIGSGVGSRQWSDGAGEVLIVWQLELGRKPQSTAVPINLYEFSGKGFACKLEFNAFWAAAS